MEISQEGSSNRAIPMDQSSNNLYLIKDNLRKVMSRDQNRRKEVDTTLKNKIAIIM
jgi:hypothetical protein